MLNKLKWGLLTLLTVVLLAAYGTLSLQVMSLTNVFLATAPKLGLALLAILAGKAVLELTLPVLEQHSSSPGMRATTKKLWSLLVWCAACFLILSIFVGDLSTLLVSAGLVGFGLTFALQKPILSFVGWLNITWKRLYSAGDLVEVGTLRGDVMSVDILTTTLLDQKGGRQITFPNSLVLEQAVANLTKDTPYVWDEITMAVKPPAIPSQKALMLRASDEVLGNKKIAENIKEYNAALSHYGVKSPLQGPEVYVDSTEQGTILRLRYLVNSKMRRATRSALYEHILGARSR